MPKLPGWPTDLGTSLGGGRASLTAGCSSVTGEDGSGARRGGQSLSNLVGDMMGHGRWPPSANKASLGCC
jgi:hypothetical protein